MEDRPVKVRRKVEMVSRGNIFDRGGWEWRGTGIGVAVAVGDEVIGIVGDDVIGIVGDLGVGFGGQGRLESRFIVEQERKYCVRGG